jgi:Secretion system C-terminal sorting domain
MKTDFLFLKNTATIFCLLILSVCYSNASAQIIYTDIPDATPNATYPLDLNNDAIDDFVIQMGAINKVVCYPQNNNAYAGEFINGTYLPWAMSQSDNICPSLATWYGSNNPGTMALGTSTGHWVGQTDKYLALKLIVGTNTYYGWVRLDVLATSSSFTIKDYAYESTPNICIKAGQTLRGINEQTSKNIISLFPNPFSTQTTLHTDIFLHNATLTIYNCFGQTVKEMKNISGKTFPLFRNNLPRGFYFVRLKEDNKTFYTNKIIISD